MSLNNSEIVLVQNIIADSMYLYKTFYNYNDLIISKESYDNPYFSLKKIKNSAITFLERFHEIIITDMEISDKDLNEYVHSYDDELQITLENYEINFERIIEDLCELYNIYNLNNIEFQKNYRISDFLKEYCSLFEFYLRKIGIVIKKIEIGEKYQPQDWVDINPIFKNTEETICDNRVFQSIGESYIFKNKLIGKKQTITLYKADN